jgi:hypothetical protein
LSLVNFQKKNFDMNSRFDNLFAHSKISLLKPNNTVKKLATHIMRFTRED